MPTAFSPDSIERFGFGPIDYDADRCQVELHYHFDDRIHFVETIRFPAPAETPGESRRQALDSALRLLHLFAGISYYKAAIAQKITCATGTLDPATAELTQTLYRHGLGEFAHQNGIDGLHRRIVFPATPEKTPPRAIGLPQTKGALVLVGGGKDSIVSIEALKESGHPASLFSVGGAGPIEATIRRAGLPWLRATRTLDPRLFDLNRQGALNGHVPVTAIVSMIAVCTAILHGHEAVVLSNERSASAGNLTLDDGFVVNHQYSKSLSFETALARYIDRHVAGGLSYFSLLRPWSELAIARAFARAEPYHDVFSSCNANFRIQPDTPPRRWCLDCPKCRFVFLALAPFLAKDKLLGIFGANLLEDASQIPGYDALLGIDAHKPFECVGEEAECAAALILLSRQPAWRDDRIVRRFCATTLPDIADPDALVMDYLRPAPAHNIPESYLEAARATLGTG